MDWNDVRVFLALYEAASFREAATRLGVNGSTVGRRLDALEEALGVRLFERSRAGVAATAAGQRLIPAARHFARAATAMAHATGTLEEAPSGRVVISAPTAVATLLLVPLLPGLRQRYPGLQVELDTNNAFVDLDGHEADLALRGSVRGETLRGGGNLRALRLGTAPLVPMTRPGYAAELGVLDDLASARWVTFGRRLAGTTWARQVLDNVPPASIVMRSEDASSVFAAAQAGLGVTWMNRFFCSDALVEVRVSDRHAHLLDVFESLWIVGHRALRDVPRVAAVWSWLEESLGPLARAAEAGPRR